MSWPQVDVDAHYARLKQPPVEAEKPKRKPKPRKVTLTETQIQRQILDLLEAHGWQVLRTNKFLSGNAVVVQGSIEKGIPDLQARRLIEHSASIWMVDTGPEFRSWRILWVEVKRPGGKCSPAQLAWHAAARARGETVLVAESVEQVAEAIGAKVGA